MKIVILDGYTTNPGDIDWTPLLALGDVTIYDRTSEAEIVERAKDAEVVLTNKVPISGDIMEKLPQLKYIGVMATGFNIIDLKAASEHNIVVTNVKGYSTNAVAQHTFALLLALKNRIETHSVKVHEGGWAQSKDFTFRATPLLEVHGKTMGLLGLGDIGSAVAKIAQAMGMKVIAYRKNPSKTQDSTIEMVDLDTLFKESDILSLHVPLNEETEGIINAENLRKMKKTSYLINTARGGLIVEKDLAEALKNRVITAAGLDVLSQEPPQENHPLIGLDNCIITPHIAWSMQETRQRLINLLSENIKAYHEGAPINQVNQSYT